jgi:lysozyme
LRTLFLVALIPASGAIGEVQTAHGAGICPGTGALEGVDVSDFNGTVDWNKVAQSSMAFAYAKSAESSRFATTFPANFSGIKAAGMKAGGHLFFHPSQEPVAQADFFVSTFRQAGFTSGDLVPMVDVEVADGQSPAIIASTVLTAVSAIQKSLGVSPLIATVTAFWNRVWRPRHSAPIRYGLGSSRRVVVRRYRTAGAAGISGITPETAA